MIDKEIEAGIKRACECDCAPPSTGWTVNPFPVISDYIERLKRRAEVAERALENIVDQYWCAERGCSECEEKQGCVEGICSRYIQQAEREIEEEKND